MKTNNQKVSLKKNQANLPNNKIDKRYNSEKPFLGQLSKRSHNEIFSNKRIEPKNLKKSYNGLNIKNNSTFAYQIPKRRNQLAQNKKINKKKFLDFRNKDNIKLNFENGLKITPDTKNKLKSIRNLKDCLKYNMKNESKANYERLSTNFEDFHLNKTDYFSNNNSSNIEIYFSEDRDRLKTTRNNIYTRSYYYDERCEMYNKVVDLSKIYSDCPGMASNRSEYINWVIKSIKMYSLPKENQVLSRTIQILDFLFCKCQMDMVQTEILTKVGISCIWIASKYEGINLSLDQLLSLLDPNLKKKFHMSKHAFLACENMILKAIDFRISSPVHTDFVENFLFRIFYNRKENEKSLKCSSFGFQNTRGYPNNNVDLPFKGPKNNQNKQNLNLGSNKNKINKQNGTKNKPPISFENFKKIIQSYKKKRIQYNKIKIKNQNPFHFKSTSLNRTLETLMRGYTNYYLKILYHSMLSCKETHYGALACILLSFQTLQKLPDEIFGNLKPEFTDKCLFFIKNIKNYSKIKSKFLDSENKINFCNFKTRLNSPKINDKYSVISGTQSTRNYKNADDLSFSSKDIINDNEISNLSNCSKNIKRISHNLTVKHKKFKEEDIYSSNEYLLLKNTQKSADSDKIRFDSRDVNLFWDNYDENSRIRFIRYKCLDYLNNKILRITDNYPIDEIQNIQFGILKLEKQILKNKRKFKFIIQDHPHPKYI